mmetsp:Transcript_19461/g.44254  ORF Transcript_19461/g.44254 Transcript_19461/m.44254 type:complete len:370 (+) Transcript_19461:108-1217(+)
MFCPPSSLPSLTQVVPLPPEEEKSAARTSPAKDAPLLRFVQKLFRQRRVKGEDSKGSPSTARGRTRQPSTRSPSPVRGQPTNGIALMERIAFDSAWRSAGLDEETNDTPKRLKGAPLYESEPAQPESEQAQPDHRRPRAQTWGRHPTGQRHTWDGELDAHPGSQEVRFETAPAGVYRRQQSGISVHNDSEAFKRQCSGSTSHYDSEGGTCVGVQGMNYGREELYSALRDRDIYVLKESDLCSGKPSLTIPGRSTAFLVSTEAPMQPDLRRLVQRIVAQKLPIPMMVLLLRTPSGDHCSPESVAFEYTDLLRLGVDQVLMEPASYLCLKDMVEEWFINGLVRKQLALESACTASESERPASRTHRAAHGC